MIEKLLKERRDAILARWLELILETYPADAHGFFKNQRNRFLNPIGDELRRDTAMILDVLTGETNGEKLAPAIDSIILVRAVQDFSPAQAIAVFYQLKDAVRAQVIPALKEAADFVELMEWERKVDQVALRAFDSYMAQRERVYEIKANALKRQSYLLLRKMGVGFDVEAESMKPEESPPVDEKGGNS